MEPNEDIIAVPPLTLGGRPWAIDRGEQLLPRLLDAHRSPATASLARVIAANGASEVRRLAARRAAAARTGIAVIPLTGVITPRGSLLSMLFGGGPGGLLGFRQEFRQAMGDADVGAIVLDIDSPGGLIDLVPETAEEVRDARGSKPVIAVANTLAASAAYWIGAQAEELVVTPSGDVGSVGVYQLHEDWSKFNEKMGVDPTYIYAGEYKVEGNPDEPLSDETKAAWQSEVDDLYAMFVDAVAAGRGVTAQEVLDGYGKGRTLMAARALEAGMVDRIDTLEAVVGGLINPRAGGISAARLGRAALAAQPRGEDPDPAPQPDPAPAPDPDPDPAPAPDPAPDPQPDPDPAPSSDDPEAAVLARRAALELLLEAPTPA